MEHNKQSGLGELLRYVSELLDQGAELHYQQMGLDYRARYTPVLRAICNKAQTVTDITKQSHITQGAVSQSLQFMEKDGLIQRLKESDGRKYKIVLTPKGQKLVEQLTKHWQATFLAIETLEDEIGYPLRDILNKTAFALENTGFCDRLNDAKVKR